MQIDLDESSYGATQSCVVVFSSTSPLEARRRIRAGNWRTHGDNPGRLYAGSCKLIAVHRGDNTTNYVCIASNYYDI